MSKTYRSPVFCCISDLFRVCRRIRSLEANVLDIRHGQSIILNSLADLQSFLRIPPMHQRPPPDFMQPYSPVMQPSPDGQIPGGYPRGPLAPGPSSSSARPRYPTGAPTTGGPPPVGAEYISAPPHPQIAPPGMFLPGNYPPMPPQGNVLPSMPQAGPPSDAPGNVSSVRFQPAETDRSTVLGKRPSSSNDASEIEDGNGELPTSGLVAPWEVLRGLADVAIERAAQVGLSLPFAIEFLLTV